MKRRIGLVLLLAALMAGGYFGWQRHEREVAEKSLTLYGNVDIRSVDLAFRVGGRLTELSFEEGDRLQTGDVVARLDAAPFHDELRLAEARQAQAAAQLAKLEAGNRPQEIAQAEALVAERRATVHSLELDHARQRELVESGAVARQGFDDLIARLAEARARLHTAEAGLRLAREGFRAEDVDAARADLAAAAAQFAGVRTQLEDTVLLAPEGGTLLTRVREQGSMVAAGQTVAVLSLDAPVWIRAYVDEPDLGRLRPGMTAEIITDTDPDNPLSGQVGFISPEAEFTPKTVQTETLRTNLVYRVRVLTADPDHRLRQGMPVTVRLPDTAAKGNE